MRFSDYDRFRLALHACYEGVIDPLANATIHVPYHSFWFVISGNAVAETAGKRLRAEVGEALLLPPGRRVQTISPGARLLSVAFFASNESETPLWLPSLPARFTDVANAAPVAAARRLNNRVDKVFPGHNFFWSSLPVSFETVMGIRAEFLQFLHELAVFLSAHGFALEDKREIDPRAKAAREAITAWPLDRPFSAPELARRLGLSTVHLDRLLVRELGHTSTRTFDRRRFQAAAEMLAGQRLMLKEVAIRLGFDSAANFNRWFRRFEPYSPSEFRRRAAARQ